MILKISNFTSMAVIAAAACMAAAAPVDAKDWNRSMNRHYSAAEESRFTPRGDNPQWGFSLDTVVNDMEWRARTVQMLRSLPKPGSEPQEPRQIADRPELRFSF
jgi:hypothetical protein